MFKTPRLGLCILLVLALPCLPCLAGNVFAKTISLQITARTSYHDGRVKVELSLVNQGDEAAKNLGAVALGQGAGARSGLVAKLPPGQGAGLKLSWPLAGLAPGRHPVALRVDYEDAKGYPLSAMAWGYFWVRQDLACSLTASAPAVELEQNGQAVLALENPINLPVPVRVSVYASRELQAQPLPPELIVLAKGSAQVELKLKNLSGRAGSVYQVLVFLEVQYLDGVSFNPVLLPVKLLSNAAPARK